MTTIFINYRRSDSSGYAGRLYDRLEKEFSRREVFMDVDNIQDGQDFLQTIKRTLGECEVVIVIIGKSWLSSINDKGAKRLDDDKDFVRLEIAEALQRPIRVIPVLVDGASLPEVADLPEPLKPLTQRNARKVSHENFDSDVAQLIASIKEAVAPAPPTLADVGEQAFRRGTECLAKNDFLGAARNLEFAADRRHVGALLKLGEMKAKGINMPVDTKEAYRLLSLVENIGGIETKYEVGKIYFFTRPTENEQDEICQKGLALIQLAAEQGHIPAQMLLGQILQQRENFKHAAYFYDLAANAGEPMAALELARLYVKGIGVPCNFAEALKWYELAADAAVTEARQEFVKIVASVFDLQGFNGDSYFFRQKFGSEICIDQEEIVRLHLRAAEYGDPSIQATIGLHFLMGQYLVQKDEAEGMRLIRAAADAGGPSAIMDIAGQLLDGQHKLLALTYLQDPTKVSDANLQMEIGFRFLDGWGQNFIDEELARKWITTASETGGVGTRLKIAFRFMNMNTNQSVATKVVADRWFQNTAAGSDAVVQLEVGKMLMRRKRGIPINRDEGLRWLHRAASNGSHEAQRLWCRYTDTEDWPAISAEKPEPSIGTPASRDFPGTSES